MNFFNPLALIGLVAATIPIVLHLLNLRKLKTVEFSTLRFLKELQKTKIRRLKIKRIILLILRTLIIIFTVFAFSRPTIESNLPYFSQTAKTSAVILLDNSFSLDLSDEFGNRFNQSKNTVLSIMNNLSDGDEIVVIPLADRINNNSYYFSKNFNYIKEELAKIKISNSKADLNNAMEIAADILSEANNINKEVYIISDCQSNIINNENYDTLNKIKDKISVYTVPIGSNSKSAIENLSIDSINLLTKIFHKDKIIEAEAVVKNYTDKDIKSALISMIFNNERVSQRAFDLAPNEVKSISISAPAQNEGINNAFLEIENDALLQDNKRYFSFIIPEKPKTLVIGSEKTSKYIALILGKNSKIESPADAEFISANEISNRDLNNYDVIYVTDAINRDNDLQKIEQYLKNGGGALFFAPQSTENQNYTTFLNKIGFGIISYREYGETQPISFSLVDKQHPLFEGVFKGTTESRQIVESPKIFKTMNNLAGQMIIQIPSGAFLTESIYENGKALYCAVSPDLEWSTLPVTGIFPTIIFRNLFYLSSKQNEGMNFIAGEPLHIKIPSKSSYMGNFKIIEPNNNEFFQQSVKLPSGTYLELENTNLFGNFGVFSQDNKPVTSFSVNPDASESNLNHLDKIGVNTYLNLKINPESNFEFIDNYFEISQYINRTRTGSELWQIFIFLAILCAIAEMLVARNSKVESE